MLVSDYFIGFYDWKLMAAVYAGIGVSFYIGWYLRQKIKWHRVILAAMSLLQLFSLPFRISRFGNFLSGIRALFPASRNVSSRRFLF